MHLPLCVSVSVPLSFSTTCNAIPPLPLTPSGREQETAEGKPTPLIPDPSPLFTTQARGEKGDLKFGSVLPRPSDEGAKRGVGRGEEQRDTTCTFPISINALACPVPDKLLRLRLSSPVFLLVKISVSSGDRRVITRAVQSESAVIRQCSPCYHAEQGGITRGRVALLCRLALPLHGDHTAITRCSPPRLSASSRRLAVTVSPATRQTARSRECLRACIRT